MFDGQLNEREILGYKLVMTCSACPEQYEVFDNTGEEVGYLRLRHGHFSAETPFGGTIVYTADTIGDGMFDTDERAFHLNAAIEAIHNYRTVKLFLR